MNKGQIAEHIRQTEEQLAKLRADLEKPEYPTLAEAQPGNKLENGCIVVHKFEETRMALIAAPSDTERYCQWSEEFESVYTALDQEGFNMSQWFIPTVKQLKLVF